MINRIIVHLLNFAIIPAAIVGFIACLCYYGYRAGMLLAASLMDKATGGDRK